MTRNFPRLEEKVEPSNGFGCFGGTSASILKQSRILNGERVEPSGRGWCQKEKIKEKISKKSRLLFFNNYINRKMETVLQAKFNQINQLHHLIRTPFSFAGSFYMIHSYFKSYTKSFSSRQVFCLALSDLLLSICDLIDIIEPASSQNCTIVGFHADFWNLLQHALDHSNSLCAFCPIYTGICWSLQTFSLSGDLKYARKLNSKSCHFISADFWWWVIIRRL